LWKNQIIIDIATCSLPILLWKLVFFLGSRHKLELLVLKLWMFFFFFFKGTHGSLLILKYFIKFWNQRFLWKSNTTQHYCFICIITLQGCENGEFSEMKVHSLCIKGLYITILHALGIVWVACVVHVGGSLADHSFMYQVFPNHKRISMPFVKHCNHCFLCISKHLPCGNILFINWKDLAHMEGTPTLSFSHMSWTS